MTFIYFIVLIALIGYNIFLNIQQKRKREKQELELELERKRQEMLQQLALQEAAKKKELPVIPANQLIKDLLANLNCELTVAKADESKELLEFSYQGGHFRVSASTKNGGFRLGFMFFFSVPASDLEPIRKLVNTLNNQTQLTRFTYSFVKEENQVFVHQLLSSMLVAGMPGLQDYWNTLLDSCFEHQRIFVREFGEMDKHDDERGSMDVERMVFLLREHEINHQNYTGQTRINQKDSYTLAQFIDTVLELPGATLTKLKIATDELVILTDQQAIEKFPLQQALIEGKGQDAHFTHNDAELVVTLKHPDKKQAALMTFVLQLQAEKATSNALYFRLSYCIPARSISKDSSMSDKRNKANANSLLLAYDKQDWQEKRSEAEYMWQEALEKIAKKEKLLPEQELLVSSTFTNNPYALYWGKKAFMDKRFYDAIFYLEQVFQSLQGAFHQLNKNDSRLFFEVCFYLGVCYNALNLCIKGYYYLNIVLNLNRISFTKEYINGLVQLGDFRALPTIDAILEHMENMEEQEGDEDENDDHLPQQTNKRLLNFRYFLLRHKAQILEEQEEWEEVEKLYKELLNDPESEDIALDKLAYLQNLQKEGRG